MAQIQQVQPVKFIVGILAISEDALARARELIDQRLGAIDFASDIWPFTHSNYYAKEMSDKLLRQFVSLTAPGDPSGIAELKLASNAAELADAEARGRDSRRAINLDPGYITPAKLILATTKDYSHRVYLAQGIYAEVTLQYHKGHWEGFAWSYPDYAGPTYHHFFCQVRESLLEELRSLDKNQ